MNKKDTARLKRTLKRIGITQADVAGRAGVDTSTVCKVVNGVAKSAKIIRAAQILISEFGEGAGVASGDLPRATDAPASTPSLP